MSEGRTPDLRLVDIVETSGRIKAVLGSMSLDEFEADWQAQWLVERGILIISEASRHLSPALKDRYPDIPWPKIAGIGNILRHAYEIVSPPVMWKLVRDDLEALERACRTELDRPQGPLTPPARS